MRGTSRRLVASTSGRRSDNVASVTDPRSRRWPPSRLAGVVGAGTLLLLPVVVWPGLAQPFSSPKLWLIALSTLVTLLLTAGGGQRVPPRFAWLAAAWVASFVLSGAFGELPAFPDTLLGIAAPLFALALVRSGLPPARVVRAQIAGASVVAVVALLQWTGWDPFWSMGWYVPIEGASVRMRVYGTVGNPNFVGALMALTVPLTATLVVRPSGRWAYAAGGGSLVLLMGALVATGSRGAVLGLVAGVVTWASLRWSGRALVAVAAVVMVGTAVVAMSPARPLQTTLAGRVYLWQVVAPHAMARPLVGQGPGVVSIRFAAWQQEADTRGVSDPRFRGLTDHVHNDFLEALVERGLPGVLTLIAPLVSTWLVARRRRRAGTALVASCAAAVVSGATCALVDFPLARPVELVWWWTAVALVLSEEVKHG